MRLDLEDGSDEKPWTFLDSSPWIAQSRFMRWLFTVGFPALAIGFVVLMTVYDWSADPVPRQRAYDQIDEEFTQIQPYPGTREISRYNHVKWRSVSFGSSYESYYDDDRIKAYYEAELPRLGWMKGGERPKWPRASGRGGARICWVKDDRVAVLRFEDTRGEPLWRFSLRMTWGLERCP